jgi:F-type H+-transporting ATPase subunit delta
MEKAYAQALWSLVERGMDLKKAVHAVHEKLASEGRSSLMPRVARAFERLAERENRKRGFVLTVAHEKDAEGAKKEAKTYTSEFGIDVADLKTQVDDSLIGGWRLEGNERLVDASYKQRLLELFNSVTSA